MAEALRIVDNLANRFFKVLPKRAIRGLYNTTKSLLPNRVLATLKSPNSFVNRSFLGVSILDILRRLNRDIESKENFVLGNSENKAINPDLFLTKVPLANINDQSIVRLESIDWRTFISSKLSGLGLEIGPLHRPMVKHSGMTVKYVDRCTVKELREHYPELNNLPLVEPDILDDAESLKSIKDQQFDFLISAHVIEHMKNPLFAMEQWCRVLKPGGLIYLIVPDKRATFDIKRVRTSLSHIVLDYRSPSVERDYEHYLDYAIHVHDMTDPVSAISEANRLIKTDYSIHFHVFQPQDVFNLLTWFSSNVRPLKVLEGPHMTEGSDEFHFLLKLL